MQRVCIATGELLILYDLNVHQCIYYSTSPEQFHAYKLHQLQMQSYGEDRIPWIW